MMANYAMTEAEEILIDRCCAWLDDEAIDLCLVVATRAADEITEPEAAQSVLVKTLTDIIVRNRRANNDE